jgi:tetratricopeptide (TPR) repeat protein
LYEFSVNSRKGQNKTLNQKENMSQSERFIQAKILEEEGKSSSALLLYEQDLQENPNSSETYLAIGGIYSNLGKWIKAESYFSRAILFDPSARNYFLLGEALYQCGQAVRAVEAFRMSLKANPSLLEAHLALATLYGNTENHFKKEVYLKNALILDESNSLVMEELISVYSKTFRFEEAVALCQKYLTFYPDITQMKILLIELLMRMEKFNSSFEYMAICMKDDPHITHAIDIANHVDKKEKIEKTLRKKKRKLLNSIAKDPNPTLAVDVSLLYLMNGDIYHSAKYLVYARQLHERIKMAN